MAAGRWLALAISLSACMAVTAAEAAAAKRAKAPAKAGLAIVRGCTHVIAPFCLGLTSGKTTYALFGANPWIPPGTGVDVWGTVSAIGPCGTTLSVTRWQRNRLKCKA